MQKFLLGVASTVLLAGLVWGSFSIYKYVNRPIDTIIYANAEELKTEIGRLEKVKDSGRMSWRESYKLGVSYHQNTDYDKAILVLEDLIKDKSDIGKAYETLGMSYFRLDKLTKAVEKWQVARQLSPDGRYLEQMITDVERKIAIRNRIKTIEEEIKRITKRKKQQKANLQNKNMPDVVEEVSWEKMLELSLLYLGEKKFDEAIEHLENAVKLKDDSSDLYDSLAQAYAMNGDFKKAQVAIKKAVVLSPGDEELIKRLEEMQKIIKAIKSKEFHNKDSLANSKPNL